MKTSIASVPTEQPERYIKQMVSHMGRKIPTSHDPATGIARLEFPDNGSCTLTPSTNAIELALTCPSDSLGRFEEVVGTHLARFGRRENMRVAWFTQSGEAGPVYDASENNESPR